MKYICETCGTIYDEEIGDRGHGVPAGTLFKDLPPYYGCASCGADKESFSKLEKPQNQPNREGKRDGFWVTTKYSDTKPLSER